MFRSSSVSPLSTLSFSVLICCSSMFSGVPGSPAVGELGARHQQNQADTAPAILERTLLIPAVSAWNMPIRCPATP